MSRNQNEQRRAHHTDMAFVIAAIFACLAVAVVEDISTSAAGDSSGKLWHLSPISIFAGTLAFLALLYFLQRMNDRKHALRYLEPYTPLLGFSGANLALKLHTAWLLLVAAVSIVWSVLQVRRLRQGKSPQRRSAPR